MKKPFLLCLILWPIILLAEEENQPSEQVPTESLFSSDKFAFGGLGGPILKVSQLGNGVITTIGGRGLFTIDRLISIGAGGYGTVAQSQLALSGQEEIVKFGYGGPGIGFKLFAHKLIHIDFFNLFGFGGMQLKNSGKKGGLFIIEPELNAELNLTKYWKLGLGASYRFAIASKKLEIDSTALFGVGGQIYCQFGWL